MSDQLCFMFPRIIRETIILISLYLFNFKRRHNYLLMKCLKKNYAMRIREKYKDYKKEENFRDKTINPCKLHS